MRPVEAVPAAQNVPFLSALLQSRPLFARLHHDHAHPPGFPAVYLVQSGAGRPAPEKIMATTENEIREFSLEKVEAMLSRDDGPALADYLRRLPMAERGRLLSRVQPGEREKIMRAVDSAFAADMLESFGEAQAVEIIESIDPSLAARILDEVHSDDQADLLAEIEEDRAEEILSAMDPEAAADARQLMTYEWDTAGGMMVKEFLAYPTSATVRAVAEDLREHREAYAEYDIQYVYVVDRRRVLKGVLRLRDLLLARPQDKLSELMIANPVSVRDTRGLHELFSFFAETNYLGLPVTDAEDRLVGVLLRSDVEESMSEEATENFLKVSGLQAGEELRSMPLLLRSRRRLSWLSINIFLNVIAASVIAANQDVLQSVIALAVFLPIISDMSGCSGNQAVGVSIRELTLGLVKPKEFVRVFWKEIQVGFLNGLVLGTLVAGAGWIWQQNPWFGLVVGGALFLNVMVAVLIGGLVPLVLKGLKADPALASGPILTTITDMCGFFFVLFFASQALSQLA
jgi:magnesium transporter